MIRRLVEAYLGAVLACCYVFLAAADSLRRRHRIACPNCQDEVRHHTGCPRIPRSRGFNAGFDAGYRAADRRS